MIFPDYFRTIKSAVVYIEAVAVLTRTCARKASVQFQQNIAWALLSIYQLRNPPNLQDSIEQNTGKDAVILLQSAVADIVNEIDKFNGLEKDLQVCLCRDLS